MASLHSRWEAKIVVPSAGWTSTLTESAPGGTGTPVFTAANTYYHSSVGNDTIDFVAELKAQLDAQSPNGRTYTVTLSAGEGGTGKLTIAVGAGTFTLTGVSADLLALMGFAGDLTPTAASFTGTQHAEGLWLPACPVETPYGLASSGLPRSASAVTMAEDGSYNAFHGATTNHNEYTYGSVAVARTVTASESVTGESYQSFWADAIRGEEPWAQAGRELRYYKDVSDDATYKTYNVKEVASPDMVRADPSYDGWWVVRLAVVEN